MMIFAKSPTSSAICVWYRKSVISSTIAAADRQQRARSGESRQIPNVRQARDEQAVDMGGREPVGERRQTAPARINHERRSIA